MNADGEKREHSPYGEDWEAQALAKVEEDAAAYVTSFRELHVYKEARQLARDVFAVSRSFPREETYSLTDQIRRASRSVSSNIAEAWGKREYEAHFVAKLSDSLTEAFETQSWLDHALDAGYIDEHRHRTLDATANFVGAMIRNMSAKSASFCGKLPR